MMGRRYILGGGIAGLIWGAYHPDHHIITDNVGGQFNAPFQLGPRFLHLTEYSLVFLHDIGFDVDRIERFEIKVGYICDEGWVDVPDIEFTQNYYLKSRNTASLNGFDGTVMNKGDRKFIALHVDFTEIIDRLRVHLTNRIIVKRVTSIDTQHRAVVADGAVLDYESLVSTIPLDVFCKLASIHNVSLQSSSMAYYLTDRDFFDLRGFDFVYDCRTTSSFHRLSRDKSGVVLDLIESRKFTKSDDPRSSQILNSFILKNAQIMPLKEPIIVEGVKFAGRYGTWNRRWKTEVVIEKAMRGKHESSDVERST
jgi:hypothetical protein